MKIAKVLMPCLLILAAVVSKAQTTEKITDEDLRKYAETMDSVKAMQETLRKIVATEVQKETVMPVARYNQLFKIIDDSVRLKAAQATPEEIAFIKHINDLRAENIKRINETYQSMARDYVGAKTFNAIHKSLKTDQALKARYDTVAKDVESKEKGG